MDLSTRDARLDQLTTALCARLTTITRTLSDWMQDRSRTLAEVEQHVRRLVQELGAALIAGLATLQVPAQPPATVSCPCGQVARFQRIRPATVTTILGPITVQRPYYLCATCGQGGAPLDAQLQICAGSRSAGLDELLALLGATQDSFAEAATVLEHLTLVHVSPNSVRDATETLGAELVAHQAQAVARAMDGHTGPPATTPPPPRLYITMDGVLAPLHDRGWSEVKVGCCYQTYTRPARKRPEQVEIHAHSTAYVTALVDAQTFGWHLWQEAAQQGVAAADEVVVVGDGAHWIWNIADTHFPGATQILDWYHASTYVWAAATAIWGERQPPRDAWAHRQLDRLWDGQVEEVLAELGQQRVHGEAVEAALSYYTTHRTRMDYAVYRARGLQIGSGNVESACKQLVSARLKGPGMIWEATGAEQVATVRAWLKSGRWRAAMALRAVPARRYVRQRAGDTAGRAPDQADSAGAGAPASPPVNEPPRGGLAPEVLARVRADLAQANATHPWRKAWSVKHQRAQHARQPQAAGTPLAA